MAESIQVNFNRTMPVFVLADTILLPHAILPLHVFEPRYRQMVNDVLDQSGQIAMATLADPQQGAFDDVQPELRPIVCVSQIVQHEGLPDGRHNVLVHGICRARIVELDEPEGERLYRRASLQPIETLEDDQPSMPDVRESLKRMLSSPRLRTMRSSKTVMEWIDRDDIPTHALLELVGFTLVKSPTVRYRLLAEADPYHRADIITGELRSIDHLVRRAQRQNYKSWPKGMSWN